MRASLRTSGADTPLLHHQPFGALDELAIRKHEIGLVELLSQPLELLEPRQGNLHDRADAIRGRITYDIGTHPCPDGGPDGIAVTVIREQDNRPGFVAR